MINPKITKHTSHKFTKINWGDTVVRATIKRGQWIGTDVAKNIHLTEDVFGKAVARTLETLPNVEATSIFTEREIVYKFCEMKPEVWTKPDEICGITDADVGLPACCDEAQAAWRKEREMA